MSDLFHVNVPFEFIRRVFVDIWAALLDPIGKPGLNHRFIIFTKRPERMLEFWNWHRVRYSIYPNDCCVSDHDVVPDKRIWIGVTCENQHCADRRIPALLQIPAAVHLVSYEPALGPLDLTKVKWAKIPVDPEYYKQLGVPAPSEMWSLNDVLWSRPADKLNKAKIGLDWVIMGAENGTHRRFMSIEWARDMAHQCQSAEVPLFYKQGPDDCGNHFRKMPMLYGRTWDQMPEIKS
jgi:protein gp37